MAWKENRAKKRSEAFETTMSTGEDRANVFRTTKVRTKLKGDCSWLQRRNEPEAEAEEEKPWLAEVRARRLNGAPIETSPVSSPVKPTPAPIKPAADRAPSSGYLMRGVFTKTQNPPSSSTSNGLNKTTQFTKKPSESYKRIAPHTVRPTSENQEGQLSSVEQEKRTEAASNVLKKSSVRQRSYVLSAAKKFESPQPQEPAPDTSLDNSIVSFVAKRVEITDDDDSAVTPAPASAVPPSPVVPVTSVASAPEPRPRRLVNTSVKTAVDVTVNEPAPPKVEEAAPEPVKEEPPLVSVTEKDPFEDLKPGCTKVATPLPELITECIQAAAKGPECEDVSGQADALLVDLSTPSQPSVAPTPASPPPASAVQEPLVPTWPAPIIPVPISAARAVTVKTEPEPESKTSPKPSSGADSLTTLSDTLISFNTSSTSFKDGEPVLAKEEGGSADGHAREDSDDESEPDLHDCEPLPDSDGLEELEEELEEESAEESAEPVPPSPGRWSQDLLGGLDSESNPAKTSGALDLLSNDAIVINTGERSLSMQREEEKQTDETAEETQSPTETVTITTKTVIITDESQEDNAEPWSSQVTTVVTESSSADPFDPYPIGTTSPNSSSDLLQPRSDISINSMDSSALVSLADDVIPINTGATSLSTRRSWARTWETSSPQPTEESQEAEGQAADQQTMVMFERKSSENDSPWDRWTSPTVYTITSAAGEKEEEEEESPEETQTVTTITTIREIRSESELVMDRTETYSRTVTVEEEEQRVQTPEPEPKKGFVYVKEYVNATEMSLHNSDGMDRESDYLTSNSIGYSYSSPSYSRVQLTSTCTYCGEQVGNDAKITIEHLNINCHPDCFKCEVCKKPMGDLLFSMFLHGGKVHCETCYATVI